MDNLSIYNKSRSVPKEAQKEIAAGRLRGKTDINPMWRLKALTEQFGVCGFGWKYEISKQWLENGANDEISAFVNINLFINIEGKWSDAIPGTGGSSFVAKEKNGPYTSDECFKMALTDAISVSCKALGFGADIYWDKDSTKYDKPNNEMQKSKLATKDMVTKFTITAKAFNLSNDDLKKIMLREIKKETFANITVEELQKLEIAIKDTEGK